MAVVQYEQQMTAVLFDCVMAEDHDEQTLDLTIEALTGTVYDLCVSPYETILGIKMKIQNLEGEFTTVAVRVT